MNNDTLPKDWPTPNWHADYGDARLELEELRSLTIAICEVFPKTKAALEIPEPGIMSVTIELPNRICAEFHSVPSVQKGMGRRFAIFVSPGTDDEVEHYADTANAALEFFKSLVSE